MIVVGPPNGSLPSTKPLHLTFKGVCVLCAWTCVCALCECVCVCLCVCVRAHKSLTAGAGCIFYFLEEAALSVAS